MSIPTVVRSESAVGALLDVLLADPRHASRAAALRAVGEVFERAERDITRAQQSAELTALGKQVAVRKALTSALGALKPHQEHVARLDRLAGETRQKALARPTNERNLERLLMEREVRDRLAGEDPLVVAPRYLQAIASGDEVTASAIENAPQGFGLLSEDARHQGEVLRLAKSPMAGQLAEEEAEAGVFRSVVATVRTSLSRLASEHGLQLDEITGAGE